MSRLQPETTHNPKGRSAVTSPSSAAEWFERPIPVADDLHDDRLNELSEEGFIE